MSVSIPGAGASEQHSKDIQPYILFGSSFPKDKEYTQVYQLRCLYNGHGIKFSTTFYRFVETSTRSRYAWRLDVQLFSSNWKISTRVCTMSSTSTTFSMLTASMWTWAFRHTEYDAEWTTTSSERLTVSSINIVGAKIKFSLLSFCKSKLL